MARATVDVDGADGGSGFGPLALVESDELADLLAERIAERLAERLREPEQSRGELIDAAEVARILGLTRAWVYEHQRELGAIRLGEGRRPRLRFERARVASIASAPNEVGEGEERSEPRRRSPRRRTSRRPGVKLLEIKGRAP